MKSKKATKRALLTSAMSLVLCFAMLLGTTFAWFTDEATTAVNTIQSGTLKVDMVSDGKSVKDGTFETLMFTQKVEDGTLKTVDAKDILWEPGATFVSEGFQIVNLGNLWLKYQLVINGIDGDAKLLEAIDIYITDDPSSRNAVELGSYLGELAPKDGGKDKSDMYYLVASMKEEAGNEYQGLSIEGVSVTVYATQKDAEYDSFGPDYDTDAVHPDTTYFNSYSFDKESDLGVFAPAPDKSSGLSITADGKAQIDASGAWYTIDADLAANEYTIEYDIDITNVAEGQNVTVDTGENVGWGSTPIMLERGSTKVYYGLSKNGEIGTLEGTKVHVTHTYSYNNDNMLEITTTVSDGVDTVTYTKAVSSAAKTTLYWDIYFATDASKATMDNFTVKGVRAKVDTAEELAAALAAGESVKLAGDIVLTGEWTPIGDKDAGVYYTGTLDGNGHTISGLSVTEGDYVALISAAKDATIKNLTVEGSVSGENAAGIVARVEGETVIENCVSNVAVTGTTKAGGIACNVTGADAKIINCTNNADISWTNEAAGGVGGIVGYVNNNAYLEIINCTNNGNVTSKGNTYAGAAVGYAAGTSKGMVAGFTNTGVIAGTILNDGRYLKDGDTVLCGYVGTIGNWIAADYIDSAEDFLALSAKSFTGNNGTAEAHTIVIGADIDLKGADFSAMIAQRGDTLTILGNGHTISNVNVVSGADDNTTGQASIFYCYPNSTLNVSNLTLKNINVTADADGTGYAAAAIGYCEGTAVLDNVDVVNATINGEKSSGMLVGHLSGSLTATDCDVDGSVTLFESNNEPNGHYAGKLIGTLAGSATLKNVSYDVTVGGKLKSDNIGDIYGRSTAAGSITVDDVAYVAVAVNSQANLEAAIATGATEVVLAAGTYTLPAASNKDVTISGTEDTVITVTTPNYSGSNVTFEGVTIQGSGYATGVQHVNTVTYNDATIKGEMCLYGEKVVFNDCTFELASGQYIWTYGAKEVEFNNCTFNTAGKAILIYNEGAGASNVTVKDCTFNATAGAKAGAIANQNCAAIEIDNFQSSGTGAAHVLTTAGNTYGSNFSGEWRIKNYVNGNTVTVNGTQYTTIAIDGKTMTIDGNKNVTVNG